MERGKERGSTGLTGVHFDPDDAITSRTLEDSLMNQHE